MPESLWISRRLEVRSIPDSEPLTNPCILGGITFHLLAPTVWAWVLVKNERALALLAADPARYASKRSQIERLQPTITQLAAYAAAHFDRGVIDRSVAAERLSPSRLPDLDENWHAALSALFDGAGVFGPYKVRAGVISAADEEIDQQTGKAIFRPIAHVVRPVAARFHGALGAFLDLSTKPASPT